MPLHNAHYQHWQGTHLGIWRRRATIALNGIRGCLQGKGMKHLVVVCWSAGLAGAAVLFLVGQLLVADSLVMEWVANLNPNLQAIARGFMVWLEEHPEISVRATQNLIFYYFTTNLATLSFIAVALAMPYLITRDLSSNAIIIYSSKAVSRFDYLIGKAGTIFGILTLTWLGPVCTAWFFGNLLAPHWRFFWHARIPLGHLLGYVLVSMLFLTMLALGVSSISRKERTTVSIWVVLWLVGNAIVPIARDTKPWLKHLSFSFNLDQVALAIFQLHRDIALTRENVPLFGRMLSNVPRRVIEAWQNPDIGGAIAGLVVFAGLAAFLIAKKVKPE